MYFVRQVPHDPAGPSRSLRHTKHVSTPQNELYITSARSLTKTPSGFFYCVLGITYPIASHWVWSSDGWLMKIGYSDFSGAGPVHLLAGTCSFVAALFIGPRIGRFSTTASNQYSGHSMPVIIINSWIHYNRNRNTVVWLGFEMIIQFRASNRWNNTRHRLQNSYLRRVQRNSVQG